MLVGHSPPFVLTTDHIKDIKLKKKKQLNLQLVSGILGPQTTTRMTLAR